MAVIVLARAWAVAHRGRAALVAAVGVGTGFAAFGATSIALWGTVREIPLWAFVPGTLVMVAGTTWDGRLDHWPAVEQYRLRVARALWVVAGLAVTTLLSVPTAIALDNHLLVLSTAVLLVVAFGPAAVDVRLATVLGGVVDLAAWLTAPRLEASNARAFFLETMPSWVLVTLLGIGSAGIVVYVWRGPRKVGGGDREV